MLLAHELLVLFVFWYRLKGISSWNNQINIIFLFFPFWTGALLSSALLPLWWRPNVCEAFIPIAQWSGLKKRDSLWTGGPEPRLTYQMWCFNLRRVKDIWDFFPPIFFLKLLSPSSCNNVALDFAFIILELWRILFSLCTEILRQHCNMLWPLSFALLLAASLLYLDSAFCF